MVYVSSTDRSCPEQQQTTEEKFEKQPRRLQDKNTHIFGQLNFSQCEDIKITNSSQAPRASK